MKKNLFIIPSLILFALLFFNATTKVTTPTINTTTQIKPQNLTRVIIEKQLGRKLNFKERVAWFVAKKEMKKLYVVNEGKEVNTNAILGLIFGYIFAPIGIIFCLIALSQINKNPEKYTGKGLAVAGLVIAIIEIIAIIALVSALSSLTFPSCSGCFDIH